MLELQTKIEAKGEMQQNRSCKGHKLVKTAASTKVTPLPKKLVSAVQFNSCTSCDVINKNTN